MIVRVYLCAAVNSSSPTGTASSGRKTSPQHSAQTNPVQQSRVVQSELTYSIAAQITGAINSGYKLTDFTKTNGA